MGPAGEAQLVGGRQGKGGARRGVAPPGAPLPPCVAVWPQSSAQPAPRHPTASLVPGVVLQGRARRREGWREGGRLRPPGAAWSWRRGGRAQGARSAPPGARAVRELGARAPSGGTARCCPGGWRSRPRGSPPVQEELRGPGPARAHGAASLSRVRTESVSRNIHRPLLVRRHLAVVFLNFGVYIFSRLRCCHISVHKVSA